MDKIAQLIEEKQNFHISSYCFCTYCGDTGLNFVKIGYNFLCYNCYSWAKNFNLIDPTWLEFISYPKYVQKMILDLYECKDIYQFFGVKLSVDEEMVFYALKSKLDTLQSLLFKSEYIIRLIKTLKIALVGFFGMQRVQENYGKF